MSRPLPALSDAQLLAVMAGWREELRRTRISIDGLALQGEQLTQALKGVEAPTPLPV